MPFEPFIRSGSDVVAGLGITPIGEQELHAYKQAQIAAHPASLLYRIRDSLFAGIVGVMMAGLVCVTVSFIGIIVLASIGSTELSMPLVFPALLVMFWIGTGLVCLGLIAIVTFPNLRVRTPACWTETYDWTASCDGFGQAVPEPIFALMRQIKAAYPRTAFIMGELHQDRVLLDPYILAHIHGTRVCLGIWDDDGVIRIAESDASTTLA